jgi:DNA-binding transcriptional ArsR family regulator
MKTPKEVNAIALPSPTVLEAIHWARKEADSQLSTQEILGKSRKAYIVKLRRLVQWRLRTEYLWSFPRIALAFGGLDHSTVMHHVQRENLARGYPSYYPRKGEWAKLSEARHQAHVQRMAIKYAGGASYA